MEEDIIAKRLVQLKGHAMGTLHVMDNRIEVETDQEFDSTLPSFDTVMYLPPHSDIATIPYIPKFRPGSVLVKDFNSNCWYIGRQNVSTFAATLEGKTLGTQVFKTNRLKVFFPIFSNQIFFGKSFDIQHPATIQTVLRAIYITALYATSYEITHDAAIAYKTTLRQTLANLYNTTICRFVIRRSGGGNHVYVRVKEERFVQS